MHIIAEITGSIQGASAASAPPSASVSSAPRPPKPSAAIPAPQAKILVQGIIGMALAEAVAFYSLFLGK